MAFEQGDPRGTAKEAEREAFAKKEFNKLLRSLLLKVHPDNFDPHKLESLGFDKAGSEYWWNKASEITKEINILKDDKHSSWAIKLEMLKRIENDSASDFLEEFERDKAEMERRRKKSQEDKQDKENSGSGSGENQGEGSAGGGNGSQEEKTQEEKKQEEKAKTEEDIFNERFQKVYEKFSSASFNEDELGRNGFDRAGARFWNQEAEDIRRRAEEVKNDPGKSWAEKLAGIDELVNEADDLWEKFEEERKKRKSQENGPEEEASGGGSEGSEGETGDSPKDESQEGDSGTGEGAAEDEPGGRPEDQNKENTSTQEDRDRIADEVRELRRAYLLKEAKAHQSISFIGRVLGKKVNSQEIPEVKDALDAYNAGLERLRDLEIEHLRSSEASGMDEIGLKAEAERIGRFFQAFQTVELETEMKAARIAAKEGKGTEGFDSIIERGAKIVKWYRGLPKEVRWAIAGACIVGGAAAALVGSPVLAGAIGGFDVARRILGAAVAGAAAKEFSEKTVDWRAKKGAQKEIDKKVQNIRRGIFEGGNFSSVESWINEEIGKSDQYVTSQRKKKYLSNVVGVGVGAALLGFNVYNYAHKLGLFGASHAPETPPASSHAPETSPAPAHAPETSPASSHAPETSSVSKNVSIVKGSSFEGTISKYLQEQGIKRGEAGRMAHRMAADFARDQKLGKGAYSLIHEGDSIQIAPDGKGGFRVSGFENGSGMKAGWMEDAKVKVRPGATPDDIQASGAEMAEAQNWANGFKGDIDEIGDLQKELRNIRSGTNQLISERDLSEKIKSIQERIDDRLAYNKEWNIENTSGEYSDVYTDQLQKEIRKLQFEKDKFEKIRDLTGKIDSKFRNVSSRMLRYLFDQGNIKNLEELKGYDASNFIAENPKSGIARISKGLSKIAGKGILDPKVGEDLHKYSLRIIKKVWDINRGKASIG